MPRRITARVPEAGPHLTLAMNRRRADRSRILNRPPLEISRRTHLRCSGRFRRTSGSVRRRRCRWRCRRALPGLWLGSMTTDARTRSRPGTGRAARLSYYAAGSTRGEDSHAPASSAWEGTLCTPTLQQLPTSEVEKLAEEEPVLRKSCVLWEQLARAAVVVHSTFCGRKLKAIFNRHHSTFMRHCGSLNCLMNRSDAPNCRCRTILSETSS